MGVVVEQRKGLIWCDTHGSAEGPQYFCDSDIQVVCGSLARRLAITIERFFWGLDFHARLTRKTKQLKLFQTACAPRNHLMASVDGSRSKSMPSPS